jgi:dolichol-phosphate mannosyltransferase
MDAVSRPVSFSALERALEVAKGRSIPGISLVIPAFNVEQVIEQTLADADQALSELTADYEILVVDDGSQDGTRGAISRVAATRQRVRAIELDTHCGEGVALRTGLAAATKDYVGCVTADGRYDVRQLERLAPLARDGHLACGYRVTRPTSLLTCWGLRVFQRWTGFLLGTAARDSGCALRLFRREALPQLSTTGDGALIHAELLFRARQSGLSVVEVGVDEHVPQHPYSRSLRTIWGNVAELLRCWWSLVRFPGAEADPTCAAEQDREPRWSRPRFVLATGCLGLVAAALLLGNLSYALIEPDESRYAQVSLEMLESGDWVVPRLEGEPYLDKPPLLYWLTAASLGALGQSELAARLPVALASWLTVLLVFTWGAPLFGSRSALLGSLLLLLSLGFVLSGRFLIMDGLLTLFTTACLLSAWIAVQGPHVRWGWWIASVVAISLGVLTKGPIALVLTVPPLVVLNWLDRRTARLRLRHWALAATAFLVLTAPWFCLIAARQDDFLYYFLWKHHVMRFVSTFVHEAPMWYYLPVLLIGMFPSSLLVVPTLGYLCSRSRWARSGRTVELGSACFAAVWILFFFSLSSGKLPTYILPAVPVLCLVQGVVLHQLLRHVAAGELWASVAHRLPAHATDVVVGIGAGLAIADMVLDVARPTVPLINILVLAFAILYALTRVARRQLSWPIRNTNWLVVAAASLLVMGFSYWKFVPTLAEYRSINANAGRICRHANRSDVPVVYYDWPAEGSRFYLPKEQICVVPEVDLAGVRRAIAGHRQALIITSPYHAELIQKELGNQLTLTRVRGARGRLYTLSAAEPAHSASAVASPQTVMPR